MTKKIHDEEPVATVPGTAYDVGRGRRATSRFTVRRHGVAVMMKQLYEVKVVRPVIQRWLVEADNAEEVEYCWQDGICLDFEDHPTEGEEGFAHAQVTEVNHVFLTPEADMKADLAKRHKQTEDLLDKLAYEKNREDVLDADSSHTGDLAEWLDNITDYAIRLGRLEAGGDLEDA